MSGHHGFESSSMAMLRDVLHGNGIQDEVVQDIYSMARSDDEMDEFMNMPASGSTNKKRKNPSSCVGMSTTDGTKRGRTHY
jgi:hypothetical protein